MKSIGADTRLFSGQLRVFLALFFFLVMGNQLKAAAPPARSVSIPMGLYEERYYNDSTEFVIIICRFHNVGDRLQQIVVRYLEGAGAKEGQIRLPVWKRVQSVGQVPSDGVISLAVDASITISWHKPNPGAPPLGIPTLITNSIPSRVKVEVLDYRGAVQGNCSGYRNVSGRAALESIAVNAGRPF